MGFSSFVRTHCITPIECHPRRSRARMSAFDILPSGNMGAMSIARHLTLGGRKPINLKPFSMSHELIRTDPDIFVVRVPFAHIGLVKTNCYIV